MAAKKQGRPRRALDVSSERIIFYCTPEERAVLAEVARRNKCTLQAFVRDLVLSEANDVLEAKRGLHAGNQSGHPTMVVPR